jgi:hypothetical protein
MSSKESTDSASVHVPPIKSIFPLVQCHENTQDEIKDPWAHQKIIINGNPRLVGYDMNVLKYAFQNFMKALATEEHPMTLSIDDLQWDDDASLQLITALLKNNGLSYDIAFFRTNSSRAHSWWILLVRTSIGAPTWWVAKGMPVSGEFCFAEPVPAVFRDLVKLLDTLFVLTAPLGETLSRLGMLRSFGVQFGKEAHI